MGELLREWRQRRRLSQLDLACEAGVSARHLSFVETGRSRPSREMVLHLAEQLEVPLRERNELLLAAGFAPVYRRRGLDDPDMAAGPRRARPGAGGHEPYPALVVDRGWDLVAANRGVGAARRRGRAATCCEPPVNVLRLSLHPDGLAPRIVNLPRVARARARPARPRGAPRPATRRWPRCTRELLALPGGDRTGTAAEHGDRRAAARSAPATASCASSAR